MKVPENKQYVLFGGSFLLANKLQWVADKTVDGLSTKRWFLLRSLADMPVAPPPTITSLAKETDTTRQNITKMLEALARDGYVLLQDNPGDRRSQTVQLTGKGKAWLKHMAAQAVPFFKDLFANISPEDCDIAAKVTVQLLQNLFKMQEGFT